MSRVDHDASDGIGRAQAPSMPRLRRTPTDAGDTPPTSARPPATAGGNGSREAADRRQASRRRQRTSAGGRRCRCGTAGMPPIDQLQGRPHRTRPDQDGQGHPRAGRRSPRLPEAARAAAAGPNPRSTWATSRKPTSTSRLAGAGGLRAGQPRRHEHPARGHRRRPRRRSPPPTRSCRSRSTRPARS